MRASFTCAVCYRVNGSCVTPLRSGGADGDTEQVLRDRNGQMILQGSSIAGAMKAWLVSRGKPEQANSLMGGSEAAGHLIVSEARFEPSAEMLIRPRLRINGNTGAADKGKKFDIAHINASAAFSFTLTWLGLAENLEETLMVEQMLSAMDCGQIRLGGQKSNGFGRIHLQIEKRSYDMLHEDDRQAWISGVWDGTPLELPAIGTEERITFEVRARAPRILIKSGDPTYEGRNKYTQQMMEGGTPILPGSSVKGAVLSRVRSIAQMMGIQEEELEKGLGRTARRGDTGLPCQVWFEDAVIEKPKKQKISRIRIDRFTGGVIRNGLFTEEPVSGALTLRISVPEDFPELCGLLLFALRDLAQGLYPLGSNGAIGRGYLEGCVIVARSGERELTIAADEKTGLTMKDPGNLATDWINALGGIR